MNYYCKPIKSYILLAKNLDLPFTREEGNQAAGHVATAASLAWYKIGRGPTLVSRSASRLPIHPFPPPRAAASLPSPAPPASCSTNYPCRCGSDDAADAPSRAAHHARDTRAATAARPRAVLPPRARDRG